MIPTSTYRLQIQSGFTLNDAAAVVDRLADLGVGAVYLSPLLTATSGSDHGYDVADPTTIDPARGGEQGWRHFVEAARAAGLGIVVDIVPNHMGIAKPWETSAWWDVLAKGRCSQYAHWFDIDWSAPAIAVPVLADAAAVDDLRIVDGELHYWENRFPLAPDTWAEGDDPREVHQRQHYRLIPWREGDDQLTHRRFFTIATLAGLRVEDPEVFAATHERVLRMVRDDGIEGLRVDHPDGLVDPKEYFNRLAEAAPGAWLVAEKILEPGEALPEWSIAGTTGYDAMTEVTQLFVDQAGEQAFTDDYQRRTGDLLSIGEQVLAGKREVCEQQFGAELRRIMAALPDPAPTGAREALVELAVRMPVYRTYLPDDRHALDEALAAARSARPELAAALDALEPVLGEVAQEAARRFQQLSGAVMAKGIEDTAWYRANRFVALNEVGGDPARFGSGLADFHAAMERRERDLPASMTSLSTHDTKRGEDVRARLAVLSEVPEQWSAFMTTFSEHTGLDDAQFAELLAQTLAGTGEIEAERLHDYATKAMREAHTHTSHTDADEGYEGRAHAAIDTALGAGPLRDAWREVQALLEAPARSNSLSQKLVQLAMPGIPDVYQGTEVWDDSLVDPDNRRPVDHIRLAQLAAAGRHAIDESGAAKLHVVRTTLRLRRQRPELFTGYRALAAQGEVADHLVAFERTGVIGLATRLPVGLARRGGWGATTLRLDGRFTDALTGRAVEGETAVSELLSELPVALLVRD